jgi:short repeat uncharacterized protein DUF308
MADTHAQSGLGVGLAGPGLLRSLADNWWLLLLRGLAAVAFGVLAFVWPGLTLITLTWLWGAYALSDGVIAIGLHSTRPAAMPVRAGGWASAASSASSQASSRFGILA